MSLRILSPGLQSSVQDLGRPGHQHLGVSIGGAADRLSARLANILVGNADDAALIESTLGGLRLAFEEDSLIALTGAEVDATLNGQPLPMWRPVWVRRRTVLSLGRVKHGARNLLAVAGGIAVPSVLGARATDLRAGFGGWQGRALRAGDLLPVLPCELRRPRRHRLLRERGVVLAAPRWSLSHWRDLDLYTPAHVRIMHGPDFAHLTAEAQHALLHARFTVHAQSDRMALRLNGPELGFRDIDEKLSAGVTPGSIQLPPSGSAFVLLGDCQTTGGYPVIGHVARVDWPRLAQLAPGDSLQFQPCTLAEAHQALVAREERLQHTRMAVLAHAQQD